MTEYQKLENMGSVYNPISICEADDTKGLDHSFVVDMERFSHLIEKDVTTPNSRIKRNLSRKGSTGRGGDNNKFNMTNGGDRDATMLTSSPRATLHGGSTPEKATVMTLGPTDHSPLPQIHHQITITNGSTAAAETKLSGRRYSFRRRSDSWAIDPKRMLLFFATLSSIGTILLIYFTLTMSKSNEDGIALDE